MNILFVTGIDTGIGKTWVTGLMARYLARRGVSVITQKLVQTGCEGTSEDLLNHRSLMGFGPLPEDAAGLTCPYLFRYPGSPHLAARLEGTQIDIQRIEAATHTLAKRYSWLLVEGVGGLSVPLTSEITVTDLLARWRYPTVVVTSPRLGSINHTLMTLEVLSGRRVPIGGIVYNVYPPEAAEIVADTRDYLRGTFPDIPWVDVPTSDSTLSLATDFGPIFDTLLANS